MMSRISRITRYGMGPAIGILIAVSVFSCSAPGPEPPAARIVPKTDTLHGDIRVDNYYWLRDRDNPEVTAYLEAENQYTEAVMKHTEHLQQKLFEEMRGRIKETDLSVPYLKDSFYYYSRTEQDKQYRIYCRKKGSLEAPEEILLDENQMAEGYAYFSIGTFSVSPDHRLIAYCVDTSGNEIYTYYFKELAAGKVFADVISNTSGYGEWAADNLTFFYVTLDDIHRPARLWRHGLGTPAGRDVMIYEEAEKRFAVYLRKSLSGEYIFLALHSNNATEYRFVRADDPTGRFEILQPRRDMVEYTAYHRGNDFYILTNEEAENFKVLKTSVRGPARRYWKTVIDHRDSVLLESLILFKDHMVVFERENALQQISVTDLESGRSYFVDFPEPIYMVSPSGNAEHKTRLLRFNYVSLVTPNSIFDFDMTTRERELKKQYEVLGGYTPDDYQSERIFAEAPDGVKVPISLVYRKGMARNGTNPLYLAGYGSYGLSADPYFSSSRLSLLDRGFIYGIAHVRGGSEMGRWWYLDGKLKHKMNTFTDYIACAEHLIAEKYTSADKLIVSGGSAGGLLVGAVLNMRPELFRIAVAEVPFVDVVNSMLDSLIPLTINEYTEWGNPADKEDYDYIMQYSPYDNVTKQKYPNILITAGLNDPNVQYWEPAKWTAKLRVLKTDKNRLLLKTNMGAGHGGASGRYDYLKEIAFEYAFLLDIFGIEE